jgi:hypothetical protein
MFSCFLDQKTDGIRGSAARERKRDREDGEIRKKKRGKKQSGSNY